MSTGAQKHKYHIIKIYKNLITGDSGVSDLKRIGIGPYESICETKMLLRNRFYNGSVVAFSNLCAEQHVIAIKKENENG